MNLKRRDFLKKSAIYSAIGVGGTVSALNAKQPGKKIKNSSGKKPEILYKETKNWEIYYENSK